MPKGRSGKRHTLVTKTHTIKLGGGKRPYRRKNYPSRAKANQNRRMIKFNQKRVETKILSEGSNNTVPAPGASIYHNASPVHLEDSLCSCPELSYFQRTTYNTADTVGIPQELKMVGNSSYTRYVNFRGEVDWSTSTDLADNDIRIRVVMGYVPILNNLEPEFENGNDFQKYMDNKLGTFYLQEKRFGGIGERNRFKIFSDKTYSRTPKSVSGEDGDVHYRRNIQLKGTFPLCRGKKYFVDSDTAGDNLNNKVLDVASGRVEYLPFVWIMNVDGAGTQYTSPTLISRWSHYWTDQ